MFDITAMGELLIDFTPCGVSEAGHALFEQNPGGAPANVLVAMARLGMKTAFIGKVGQDMHGRLLRDTLEENGICTDGLILDPEVFTTLAFVQLKNGERDFAFARKPGADTMITEEELNGDLIRDSYIFHFGSLSLTDEPARTATQAALKIAKAAGAIISYDPNYRAPLWPDRKTAIEIMRSPVPSVDIMKISDEETGLLTGTYDPNEAAGVLLDQGVKIVVVTLGSQGALLRTRDFCVTVPSEKTEVVDTTGAGDSFWGGFLSRIAKSRVRADELTEDRAKRYLRFANTVAGLCVGKRGAIPAMPSEEEVRAAFEQ